MLSDYFKSVCVDKLVCFILTVTLERADRCYSRQKIFFFGIYSLSNDCIILKGNSIDIS